jgi:hypothetical protein
MVETWLASVHGENPVHEFVAAKKKTKAFKGDQNVK